MRALNDFVDDFQGEVGDEVFTLFRSKDVERWLNRAQARLGVYRPMSASLSWNVGDTEILLPSDFREVESVTALTGSCLPDYREWGGKLVVLAVDGAVSSGQARLLYKAYWPQITSAADSVLPDVGDDAVLSFALYRAYKKLASSRSDYRKYATMTGANGVDIGELDDLSERHLADFETGRDELTAHSSTFFYSQE